MQLAVDSGLLNIEPTVKRLMELFPNLNRGEAIKVIANYLVSIAYHELHPKPLDPDGFVWEEWMHEIPERTLPEATPGMAEDDGGSNIRD